MANQYKQWTKEEIIKAIRDFYERNNRTPRMSEFGSNNNLPSYAHVLKVLEVRKIQEIFNFCSLIRTEAVCDTKIDSDWALGKLKEYYNIYKKILTMTEYNKLKLIPEHSWYCIHFESFENACYLAGIIDKPLSDKERIKISICELVELANKLNKCPTVAEYESEKYRGFSRRDLEKKLSLKYNDICKKYIFQFKLNNEVDIPKEKIIADIRDVFNKLGRAPLFKELKKFGLNYSFTTFNTKFNMDYNELIISMGYTPSGTTTLMRTKDEMLKDFNDLFLKLKRIPFVNDFANNNDIADYSTYIRYFDSIENVCQLLNIDYEKYYKGKTPGKVCLDKNGDKCRSLIECNITNFLIDNSETLEYIKEPKYNELIKSDKRKFDWKLLVRGGDTSYYIEYAGMYYNDKPRGDITKKYKVKIDNKIKDLQKCGHLDKCLFIYPEDIKTKTLKEIFESFLGVELKHVENTYDITYLDYFCLTDEELLKKIMIYSNDKNILPSTAVISKNELGVYKQIIRRYKTYDNFAKHFGKMTLNKNYNSKVSIYRIERMKY